MQKLDVLVFAAHPDDAELACSGTISKLVSLGKKVGICDLTQGEMGTRGNAEQRIKEAEKSSKVLKLTIRENLNLGDCFFDVNKENTLKLVEVIRKFQPNVVLTNSIEDRHPDHSKGCEIAKLACFWSGLRKIETQHSPYRPERVYHYIQDTMLKPDFVVDISNHFENKLASIKAFESQFFNPLSKEPESYISTENFWHHIDSRAREFGHLIQKTYGEGFKSMQTIEMDIK